MDQLTNYRTDSLDYAQLQATVLGSILQNGRRAAAVIAAIAEDDFDGPYRELYAAIRTLHFAGDPVDRTTVQHRLGEDELWRDFLPTVERYGVENPLPYCRMLHEKVVLEAMKGEALGIQHAKTYDEASETAERLFGLLNNKHVLRRTTAQEATMALLDRLDKKPEDFIRWGLDGLDEPCTHTRLGDFVVLGGYPSAGKSMLAAQLAQTLAERYRVAFFNVEGSEEDTTARSFSRLSGVPLDAILENRCTDAQLRAIARAAERYYSLQFDVFDAAGSTPRQIEAAALAGRYQVIVVDYMQLLRMPGVSRYEKVTEISMALHTMAQRHKILVIALAQLTRPDKPSKDAKPVPPGMSSFRESGQIEQDADLAMILYQEDPNKAASRRILKMVKNKKNRRSPNLTLDFHGETQLFTEVIPEYKPRPKPGKSKPGENYRQEEMPL